MSTINDLIQAAVAGEPVAIADTFGDLMAGRIATAVDAMVPEVSKQFFAPSEE